MLQVTAEVQPMLAAQLNSAISLDRRRMVDITFALHLCSSRYMTKQFHTPVGSCRPARYLSTSTLVVTINIHNHQDYYVANNTPILRTKYEVPVPGIYYEIVS